jgi:serine/threonine protein kinase
MLCLRHPAAASHRGYCAACLLEGALGHDPDAVGAPAQQHDADIIIQLPLGRTTSSSVFLAKSQRAPSRLLRLKTWHRAAPSDFMMRFQRLARQLSEWNDDTVRTPLAAWVDISRHAWVLSEFNQGMPLVDRVRSSGLHPTDAEACLDRLRQIVRAAHGRGLVHGSIGGGNIIVTARCDRAYLLDFGHAALLADDGDHSPDPAADIAAVDRLTAAVRRLTPR